MNDSTPASTLATPRRKREVYIDAFRGFMAVAMVQGHVFTSLLAPEAKAQAWYTIQAIFHGSTAPGFLFASGFVAGLPRAPLSLRAGLRRARRLLFVLAVGYYLHLPYFSFWKTLAASPAEKLRLYSCDALQVIALSQLFVLMLQWVAGRRWTLWAGAFALGILAAAPGVWAAGWSQDLHPFLGAYLDKGTGSHFPIFPYSAFVLAGTVAGAALGRQDPERRHRRMVWSGLGILALGWAMSYPLEGWIDYWGPSPAYAFVRIGGLILFLRLMEMAADRRWAGVGVLALLGHETLQVFCLHLLFLYGGVIVKGITLTAWLGRLGPWETWLVLAAMMPVLYAAAWLWHRFKVHAPREASATLVLLSTWFLYQFFTRPW